MANLLLGEAWRAFFKARAFLLALAAATLATALLTFLLLTLLAARRCFLITQIDFPCLRALLAALTFLKTALTALTRLRAAARALYLRANLAALLAALNLF